MEDWRALYSLISCAVFGPSWAARWVPSQLPISSASFNSAPATKAATPASAAKYFISQNALQSEEKSCSRNI